MTTVSIIKEMKDIKTIKVTGHAFYADYGQDIVCSAISMICYTIANKLLFVDEDNVLVTVEEGKFEIKLKHFNNDNQLLMSTLVMGLQMLEEQYGKNVKIEEV